MTLHKELLAPLLDKALEAGAIELILTGELKPQIMMYNRGNREYREIGSSEILTGQLLNDTVRSIRSVDRSDTGEYEHKGEHFRYALTPGAILFRHIPGKEQIRSELSKLTDSFRSSFPANSVQDGLQSAADMFCKKGK